MGRLSGKEKQEEEMSNNDDEIAIDDDDVLDKGKWQPVVREFDKWLDRKFSHHMDACPKCKDWDGLTHGICDYALALKECINQLNRTIEKIL